MTTEFRQKCPICDDGSGEELLFIGLEHDKFSEFLEVRYRDKLFSATDLPETFSYWVRECGNCGLIYQVEVLSNGLLEKFYSKPPSQSEKRQAKQSSRAPSYLKYELAQFAEIGIKEGDRIFDFGVGYGVYAKEFLKRGYKVDGCEFNDDAAEHARVNGVRILEIEDLEDNSYHLVNTDQVFEHLIDPISILDKLVPSIRPGGFLKLAVPQSNFVKRQISKQNPFSSIGKLRPLLPLGHVNCFCRKTFLQIGNKYNLRLLTGPRVPFDFSPRGLYRFVNRRFNSRCGYALFQKPK